jgi:hypothetical protein
MQNDVSSVVWPWREKAAAQILVRKTGPAASAVLLQATGMAAVGSALYWWLGHRFMGVVAFSLAAIVLVAGFFLPRFFAAIKSFGKHLGRWVGTLLTWGLLAPFYYIFFAPAHLALKIKGKDPLHRQCPTVEPTYWTPRKPVKDLGQYRKQF